MEVLLLYLIVINTLSFLIYGYDKFMAKNKKRRVSEFSLLLLGGLGGIVGGIVGMYFFKHKTNKFSFLLIFYTVVVIEVVILFCVLTTNPVIL